MKFFSLLQNFPHEKRIEAIHGKLQDLENLKNKKARDYNDMKMKAIEALRAFLYQTMTLLGGFIVLPIVPRVQDAIVSETMYIFGIALQVALLVAVYVHLLINVERDQIGLPKSEKRMRKFIDKSNNVYWEMLLAENRQPSEDDHIDNAERDIRSIIQKYSSKSSSASGSYILEYGYYFFLLSVAFILLSFAHLNLIAGGFLESHLLVTASAYLGAGLIFLIRDIFMGRVEFNDDPRATIINILELLTRWVAWPFGLAIENKSWLWRGYKKIFKSVGIKFVDKTTQREPE